MSAAPSSGVAELVRGARAAGRLGIDTEFMGEGRYRSLLCLVQVAVADGDGTRVEVLDPLAEGTELAPLATVLSDPQVEVVMHAGRQDVALLRRYLRCDVRTVFDTQVAAGFAGLRAQAGYEALLGEVLGVRLRKSASYTRWDARPLTREQLMYAREDVEHLLDLAAELQRRLAEQGRLEWAREECEPLEHASDERDVETIFARLPRIAAMDPAARAVAHELVEWREAAAAANDMPAATVLNDAALVEIARRRPDSMRQLSQLRGLNQGTLRRRGDALLAAIGRGRERPPLKANGGRRVPPHPDDAALVALAEAFARTRAREANLAYELVAARADLQEIVTSVRVGGPEPDVRTLHGWRRRLVGAELLELLAGQRSLSVAPDRRVRVSD